MPYIKGMRRCFIEIEMIDLRKGHKFILLEGDTGEPVQDDGRFVFEATSAARFIDDGTHNIIVDTKDVG